MCVCVCCVYHTKCLTRVVDKTEYATYYQQAHRLPHGLLQVNSSSDGGGGGGVEFDYGVINFTKIVTGAVVSVPDVYII